MRLAAILIPPLALLALPAAAEDELSAADSAAAFNAAGFAEADGEWRACEDPGTAGYMPGQIAEVRELNGDGLPEAIITEGSIFCYGGDEVGSYLVGKQPDNSWKLVLASEGIFNVLPTRGADDWPDIEIGGQGFCFPVQRWNGSEYELDRLEYEGQPCEP